MFAACAQREARDAEQDVEQNDPPSVELLVRVLPEGEPTRAIARELMFPTRLTHVVLIGDSRNTSKQDFIAKQLRAMAIGGLSHPILNTLDDALGAHSSAQSSPLGDAPTPNPHTESNLQLWSAYGSWESRFSGATEPSGNDLVSRMFYAGIDKATYPLLWRRLEAKQQTCRARAIYRRLATGTTRTGVRLHWRSSGTNATDPGNHAGDYVVNTQGTGYGELSVTIPNSHDWAQYDTPTLEIMAEPGATTVPNEIFALGEPPWIEMETGAVLHSYAVGGRSIDGFLDEDIFPEARWSDYVPLLGEHRMLWLDIGTNNPLANTREQHVDKLLELIRRFRAGSPGGSVMMTTSYPAASDVGTPYYVLAARDVATRVSDVLLLDTYASMPSYEVGAALGYYGDTVHYGPPGVHAFYSMISDLIEEAAGEALWQRPGVVGYWDAAHYATADGSLRVSGLQDLSGNGNDLTANPGEEPTLEVFTDGHLAVRGIADSNVSLHRSKLTQEAPLQPGALLTVGRWKTNGTAAQTWIGSGSNDDPREKWDWSSALPPFDASATLDAASILTAVFDGSSSYGRLLQAGSPEISNHFVVSNEPLDGVSWLNRSGYAAGWSGSGVALCLLDRSALAHVDEFLARWKERYPAFDFGLGTD